MRKIRVNFFDLIKIFSNMILNLPLFIIEKIKIFFLSAKAPKIILKEGSKYRDLNRNGKIDIYEDNNFSAEQRAADLLSKMSLEEKVGQMFHPPISLKGGAISEIMNLASGKGDSTESLILNKHISHFNLYGSPSPLELSKKLNYLQRVSEKSRLAIPLTISSDPIHEVPRGGGIAAFSLKGFSKWPSQLGFAATRDSQTIKELAEIAG